MLRLVLIAASNRQPEWVVRGYEEYAARLRGRCRLELKELRLARRSGAQAQAQAVEDEGARMLAGLPPGAHAVALDERGAGWSTVELAQRVDQWRHAGAPVCLFLGGPDGLAPAVLERARERWSLSPLTLPHGLARIVVAEALYRAWSLLEQHPYHRP